MNAVTMIALCGKRQVGDVAYPPIETRPFDPDPANHETLSGVSDHGLDGHARSEQGLDDHLVPPRPVEVASS